MKLHTITGLPRAGSTLLCNVLNQNPRFWATSTSILPQLLNTIIHTWSNSVEVKNLLEKQKKQTEERMLNSLRAFVGAWHKYSMDKKVIFDKSRGWSHDALLFNKLFPNSKMIVMVRDLRDVFASIEKEHRKNPLLDLAENQNAKSIFSRADMMFSPNGMIGSPLEGVGDILRREPKGVILVQFETFIKNPKLVLEKIYAELGEKYFKHNFKNVKNTAIDCDGHYLHKFPHKGSGEIKARPEKEWKKYLPKDLANTLMERFQQYNRAFGYRV